MSCLEVPGAFAGGLGLKCCVCVCAEGIDPSMAVSAENCPVLNVCGMSSEVHAATCIHACPPALSAVTLPPAECVRECRGGLQPVQLSRLRPSGSALQRCHPPPAESSGKLHLLAGPHLHHHAASLRV